MLAKKQKQKQKTVQCLCDKTMCFHFCTQLQNACFRGVLDVGNMHKKIVLPPLGGIVGLRLTATTLFHPEIVNPQIAATSSTN
jgi:hypothetical protein